MKRTKTRNGGHLAITIRPAYADDHSALVRLAALDSALPLEGPMLVAEADGELRAALSRADARVIADPFFPTAHLLELLRAHAAATAPQESAPGRLRLKFA